MSKMFSELEKYGAMRHPMNHRAGQPMGPNPEFLYRHTYPVFRVNNDGIFRNRIKIELRNLNGNPFPGSLTRHEAKHHIYKEILGWPFRNFRGIKMGFRNILLSPSS
jgi:hypothetical protein